METRRISLWDLPVWISPAELVQWMVPHGAKYWDIREDKATMEWVLQWEPANEA